MADPNATSCAACGARGDLQEHHVVPKVCGGTTLPTVMLCLPCHGLVHERIIATNHAELTRRGLAAAKARGIKLGNPHLKPGNAAATFARSGRDARSKLLNDRARDVASYIEDARAAGCTTLGELARALTARGIPTPGGGAKLWRAEQVSRVLRRLESS